MDFNTSIALNWILFIALFPISYFWIKRAYQIIVKRDFSEVALKNGESPDNPAKFAPFVAGLNVLGAIILVWTITGVLTASLHFDTWTAMAGSTIWMKLLLDFMIQRHAHMKLGRDAKKPE